MEGVRVFVIYNPCKFDILNDNIKHYIKKRYRGLSKT